MNKKNTIVNNYILSIQEDNDNNLWVGTNKGISKINLETEEITNFEKDENGNIFYKVRSILLTKRGTVLVITQDNVYMYDKELDKFKISLDEGDIFSEEDIMDIKESIIKANPIYEKSSKYFNEQYEWFKKRNDLKAYNKQVLNRMKQEIQ